MHSKTITEVFKIKKDYTKDGLKIQQGPQLT